MVKLQCLLAFAISTNHATSTGLLNKSGLYLSASFCNHFSDALPTPIFSWAVASVVVFCFAVFFAFHFHADSIPVREWCGQRDSNPHAFRHLFLRQERLPVPPCPLCWSVWQDLNLRLLHSKCSTLTRLSYTQFVSAWVFETLLCFLCTHWAHGSARSDRLICGVGMESNLFHAPLIPAAFTWVNVPSCLQTDFATLHL